MAAARPTLSEFSVPVVYDTGANAHIWSELADFDSFRPFPDGPRWISGISQYVQGSGSITLQFQLNNNASGLPSRLHGVYYIPDLIDHRGQPVRLFSHSAAQVLQPNLKAVISKSSSYLKLPIGQLPLHNDRGLLYMHCRMLHPQKLPAENLSEQNLDDIITSACSTAMKAGTEPYSSSFGADMTKLCTSEDSVPSEFSAEPCPEEKSPFW